MQNRLHNRVDHVREMPRRSIQPFHEIESRRSVKLHGISLEYIRHDNEVAISGKLVRDELRVDEFVADDVCEDQDCALGGTVGWVGEVGFDWRDRCCYLLVGL